MPLDARLQDLRSALGQLESCVANCDSDIAAADPQTNDIQRVREVAIAALNAGGLDNSVWS